jgi:transposase
MDGIEVSGEDRQPADHSKRIRRRWTTEQKRRMVREAERPGAVRQQVAQRHGVHLSVLNRWRKELRIGAPSAKKPVRRVRLLPIRVSKTQAPRAASQPARVSMAVAAVDSIEVAFTAGQRVTVRGLVDGGALRTVLQELARC